MNNESAEVDRALDQEAMLQRAVQRDEREAVLRVGVNARIELASDSPLRHLIMDAENDAVEALRVLATHSADDVTGIRELQNRVYRATALKTWLFEMIEKAEEALKSLDEESDPA